MATRTIKVQTHTLQNCYYAFDQITKFSGPHCILIHLSYCLFSVSAFTELKCGNRVYSMVSPLQWTCCGNKLYSKKANFFACCNKKCYNPASQYCCGNTIYARLNINSACCNGKVGKHFFCQSIDGIQLD